jgi:hypothetical protein
VIFHGSVTSGAKARNFFAHLTAALKRRSSTAVCGSVVHPTPHIEASRSKSKKIKINVKGSGRGRPLYIRKVK